MTTLWSVGRTMPAFPQAGLHGRYDVLVVGAGLTGLITALLLREQGCRVALVEARQVGAGTTGASTAKISLLQGTRLSAIAAKHTTHTLRQYVAGNQFGLRWLLDFCTRNGVAVQRPSAVTYAATTQDLPEVEREQDLCAQAGLDVAWRATDSVPFPFVGGISLPEQAQLDPLELLAALAEAAHRAGVTIATGQRVVSLGSGREPEVLTTKGAVRADRIILATGIPIADRGGFFARLVPERSYLVALRAPSTAPMDMYFSAGSPIRSVRCAPAATGQWLLVGGNGHQVGRAQSEAAALEELVRWAQSRFPSAEVAYSWSAQDYHPVDELPYVGPLTPVSDRVLVATGFAKWGLANAPAAAAVLASYFDRPGPDWAEAYASWNAHELSGVVSGTAHNARVLRDLAADRISALGAPSCPEEGQGTVGRDGMGAVAVSTVDGQTRQLSATCPHLGGLVRWNDAEKSWDCPLHGSRFTAEGDLIEGPATRGLSES